MFAFPKPLLCLPFLAVLLGASPVFGAAQSVQEPEVKEPLTVAQAKGQMVQLYIAEKVAPRKLSTKYPELREASKATRDASRELFEAIKAHPQLKKKFDEVENVGATIPEQMKLWQPLIEEAQDIPDLKPFRVKYEQAQLNALKTEIKALKAEGYDELVEKLEAVLAQVQTE